MRISATGTRGFTLIELLVVVAIVGVVLALAAVNLVPSDAEVARRETGLVASAIENARDAAWCGGRPTALSFEEGRLRQWRLSGERDWQPDSRLDRDLGEVRIASLHVDGESLSAHPRLVFLADGLGVPFRLTLEVRGQARAIEGDAAGSVRMVER
jgi:type II secretion system protein H